MKVAFEMEDDLYETVTDVVWDMGYGGVQDYLCALVRNDLEMYGVYGVKLLGRIPEDLVPV